MPGTAKFYRSGNVNAPELNEITVLPASTRLRFDNSATIYTTLDEVSINSGSILFNGSSYLTVADTNIYNVGTGDFTVEFWANWSAVSASVPGNVIVNSNSGNFLGIYITNAALQIARNNTGGDLTASATQSTGVWNHYAFTRNSSIGYIFKDGTLLTTGTVTTNYGAGSIRIGASSIGTSYVNGYLSNVRITKGQALYTSNFTPKKYIQEATTVTSLLLSSITSSTYINDSSFNNFTVTPTGSPTYSTLNPFDVTTSITTVTPTTVTTSSISVGSMYFNGSSGAIYYPTNTSTVMSGDFTIELFFNLISTAGQELIRVGRTSYNHARGLGISLSGTSINFYASTDGANWNLVPTGTYLGVTNRWYHVAVTRSGSTFRIFVDGTITTSTTSAGTLVWDNPGNTTIGAAGDPGSINVVNGYVSNVRIVNGTALYTSNFSIPATPLTSVTNTVLLLNTVNSSTYRVDSASNFSSTVVGAATRFDSANPFEGGSIYFNGNNNLSITGNQKFVFTNDLTVEGWVYIDSTMISSRPDNLKIFIFVGWNVGSTPQFYVIGTTTTAGTGLGFYDGTNDFQVAVTIPKDQWVHLAFVRTGSIIYGFVNGTRYTISGSYSTTIGSTDSFLIAGTTNNIYYSYLKGYINNLRITKDQALYTSNFTVSTASFTATTATSLLLPITNTSTFLIDASLNKFTVTNNGTSASLISPFNITTTTNTISTTTSVLLGQRLVNDGNFLIKGEFSETIINDSSLLLYLDSGDIFSYPGTGTAWRDLSRNNYHHTIFGSSSAVTIDNVRCIDTSVASSRYVRVNASSFTFGPRHTMIAWARPLADSQVTNWRTLWRTSPNDHPLLIQDGTNIIGYWDSDTLSFNSYGINAGTIGIENKWTMFSLVSTGTSTTLYINDLQFSGTVNFTANGQTHQTIGASIANDQQFGYVAVALVYNRNLSTSEISQTFNALKTRFGL